MNEGYTPSEISEIVSGSIIRDIRKNDEENMKPQSLKGAEALEQKNLLPLNIHSQLLPLLSLLISATFWRGGRSLPKNRPGSSQNQINISNSNHEKMVIKMIDALDVRTKEGTGKKDNHIKYWSVVGRVIELMGFPAGKKAEGKVIVPGYLKAAFNSLEDLATPEKEWHLAHKLLHDFILTLLYFRFRIGKFTNLISLRKEEDADSHGELIRKIALATFPGFDFKLGAMQRQAKSSYQRMYFSGPQSTEEVIEAHYFQRVEEAIAQGRQATAAVL